MSEKTIIVIEDEPDILEVLSYNLKRAGFNVAACQDGLQGLQLVRQRKPALLLLDLMLPGMDGLELCRCLKEDSRTRSIPIIMISAKGEESDVIVGLTLGADDYVTKPFSPKELIARIKAVLRRSDGATLPRQRIEIGELAIDQTQHSVLLAGQPIALTASEFRLLYYLASNVGRVFSRAQLLDQVSAEGTVVVDRIIDVHIRSIRKKLGETQRYIETVRGVGYRFRASES